MLLVVVVVAGLAAVAAEPALLFHNGVIVPMTSPDQSFSAMLVRGSLIERLGADNEILALADEHSTIIDLDGRAVYPGLIDPHAHLLGHASLEGLSMVEAEQLALECGLAHGADMHIGRGDLLALKAYASGQKMRLRVSIYLTYDNGGGSVRGA